MLKNKLLLFLRPTIVFHYTFDRISIWTTENFVIVLSLIDPWPKLLEILIKIDLKCFTMNHVER